jgi:hypothetical protein
LLLARQRLSDFPVVPQRIDDSSEAPAISIGDRPHNHSAGCDSPFENGIRIVDSEHQPRRTAA